MVINWVHPGLLILLGSLLIPVIKHRALKKIYFLSLPIAALIILVLTSYGIFGDIPFSTWRIPFLGYDLVFGRIDKLSMVFAYVFVIAAICMNIYALHVDKDWEHVSAMFYVGSALGVVFAGDLITLYIFWEIMAWSSLPLIWFRGTRKAHEAGFRYIMWHLFGGTSLLAGIIIYVLNTGSIAFERFPWGYGWDYLPSYLVLLGFIINAAVPPLHAWLPDAYPEATVTGAVYMTAFTTKSAVYTLIRGFPGVELLMWLGAIMAMYGVIYAVLENDGRRLLAYHIISQVGYMVCGVGIGTEIAINGATAHAFCHILYKALLFMGMGAVIEVTGRSKFTELGGIYKYMPITFWLYMIGAFSISGFPLFNGFVSKTMTVHASALIHQPIIWLLLEGASIGTFLHTGLKLPWNVWFAREKPADVEAKEPPKNMLAGMGLTAFLCVFFGVYPGYKILYDMLPYPVHYEPYALGHVIEMSQLLLSTFLGFWVLRGMLHGEPKISLDTDWLFRLAGRKFIWFCEQPLITFAEIIDGALRKIADFFAWLANNPAVASRMLVALTGAIVFKPFHPLNEKYERDLNELKRVYSDEVVHRMGIGTGVLLVLIFFTLYLFIYLSYGVLWR